ncbi:MFS transporter [Nocardia mangyaensis]|uniref:MFS transporter n=1 Tax=Nocardia mangyaensis TaxID=2213200 RepID=A0A1J0VKX9_9NOCA|nr:MFS transporter [Nocardia mangyaensis]APE32670.1 MFS transporter [Nocardia mangyaensis]
MNTPVTTPEPGVAPPRATARDWAGLAVLALALLLLAIDATVLDLAVPAISADLAPSTPQLLWIIDVYSFVLAGLLVVMGNLGDRIGRRKLLLIGAAGFGIASALAAWAGSPEMLIAARVLQGVAGATLMPATLGLIRSIFQDPRQRTVAIGVWSAMAGGGAAAGPLVGGWLLEHFWWGSVFLVNLPVMAGLLVLAPLLIPESRDPHPGRFDAFSAVLAMLALVPVVYAIKETAAHGLDLGVLVIGLVGVGAGMAFTRRQRRLADPMLDLRLFALPRFRVAVLTNMLAVFALAGVLFFGSQYLQLVLGRSPLDAGLLMVPGLVASVVGSLTAALLVRRWRAVVVLGGALVVTALGAAAFFAVDASSGAGAFVLGFTGIGLGAGVAMTVSADLVVGSAPAERAGAAAAISETAYEVGLALGVAVLGSTVMAVFRRGLDLSALPGELSATASDSLSSAVDAVDALPPSAAGEFLSSVHESFVSGIHLTVLGMVAVLLFAAITAVRTKTPRE